MRALHFVNHSLPVTDGYSIRTHYLVKGQQKLGLEPVVVTRPRFSDHCHGKLGFRENVDNIPHFHFDHAQYPLVRLAGRMRKAKRYLEHRYTSPYYRRVIKECAPCSVFHVHMQPDQIQILLPLSRQHKVPLVYELRGVWEDTEVACGRLRPETPVYETRRNASTRAAKEADHVITISDGLRQDFIRRGVSANKISVVPNGVDTSLFVPTARDEKLAARFGLAGKVVLGYISSIRRLEGLEYLVRAMPEILESVPDCVCLIVGDGEYAEQLRDLARSLKLEDKVILTGKVDHRDILAYYSLIDIFVVPRTNTRVNNLVTPLKPLEAMSMAKALLVSEVGGLTELVQNGLTGLVFAPEDAGDLARKAILLAGDPALRRSLGEEARRHVVTECDWSRIISAYPWERYGRQHQAV